MADTDIQDYLDWINRQSMPGGIMPQTASGFVGGGLPGPVPSDNRPDPGAQAQPSMIRQDNPPSPQSTGNYGPPPQYPVPPAPQLMNAPQAQPPEQGNPFEVFKNPVIALSVIGSLFTRRPLINAMTAAGSAMNGYQKQQDDVFNQNKERFHEQLEQAAEQNRTELVRYNALLQRTEIENWNKVLPDLWAEAVKNDDKFMMAALKAGPETAQKAVIQRMAADESVTKAINLAQARETAHNQEVERLKQDPGVLARVDRMQKYEMALPPSSRNNPTNEAILELAGERGIDQTGYGERNKAIQIMASGNGQGGRIISLNTAIRHFRTLDRLTDALGNGDFVTFNKWRQSVAEQRGLPDVTNYDLAADIVSKEIVKSLVANGGGQTERSEIEQQFSHGHSPEQLHGLVQTGRELLGSQFKSVQNWAEAAHAGEDFNRRIEPEARAVLEGAAEGGPAPVKVKTPQEAQKLAPGTHYLTPDGNEYVR